MTIICLVRHGQTNWNKQSLIQGRIDNLLNEEGIKQAHETANKLLNNDPNWDVIISSPLSRAYNTSLIIKEVLKFNKDIIINNNVIEREFGKAEGQYITKELYDLIKKDEIEGMEKTKDLQARAYEAIMDIANSYKDQKVLIVSHSHFVKGLFTYIDKDITFTSYLPNAGISYVMVKNGKIIDHIFNRTFEE